MANTMYPTPKVKICGITEQAEIAVLNQMKVEYAGFVFYEKSKRNISGKRAESLIKGLHPGIGKVAVTVNPTEKETLELCEMGFDILQVHGTLSCEAVNACQIPIWKAINILDKEQLAKELQMLSGKLWQRIEGIVADGASYGAGIPFSWQQTEEAVKQMTRGRKFILAGGLNTGNVADGMERFRPDVVDVSTGVEVNGKKNEEKIKEFIRKVREHE